MTVMRKVRIIVVALVLVIQCTALAGLRSATLNASLDEKWISGTIAEPKPDTLETALHPTRSR